MPTHNLEVYLYIEVAMNKDHRVMSQHSVQTTNLQTVSGVRNQDDLPWARAHRKGFRASCPGD